MNVFNYLVHFSSLAHFFAIEKIDKSFKDYENNTTNRKMWQMSSRYNILFLDSYNNCWVCYGYSVVLVGIRFHWKVCLEKREQANDFIKVQFQQLDHIPGLGLVHHQDRF